MHYVYQHRRNDTGAVFYVGKGSGARARVRQGRNPFWHAVVAKAGGYSPEVVVQGVDEEFALLAEMELIDALRRRGQQLTNLTDGGEGMSGYKMPADVVERRAAKMRGRARPDISARMKGVPKSEETKRRLALAHTGKRSSEETKRKLSAASRGRPSSMKGKRHTEATKAKIAAAVSGDRAPFLGRTHSAESLARMSAAHTGRVDSAETRAKKSAARHGAKNPRYGVIVPDEQKGRQRAALKARARVSCPHCSRVLDESNAKRWHFDNCKAK